MSSETDGDNVRKDTRILCQYGDKCYRKNPFHLAKYKHLRSKQELPEKNSEEILTGTKRKNNEADSSDGETASDYPKAKVLKADSSSSDIDVHDSLLASDCDYSTDKSSDDIETDKDDADDSNFSVEKKIDESIASNLSEHNDSDHIRRIDSTPAAISSAISELFLTEMPEDFYQFYKFCQSIAKGDASAALKPVKLELVGPYDVLTRRLTSYSLDNKEKYLRHWRYYYDPPEFQTVIKCDDKDGLHFGYWRDNISEKPIFVARNKANVNCIIERVASNLFGAMNSYIEDKMKVANPFERSGIVNFHRKLKQFISENDIALEKNNSSMKTREKSVVARTFHKAGIVVPYDKKTQVGYRDLAATDSTLQKIIKSIEEAATPEKRRESFTKLEEIVRLATIAADECDFGTCLELAHDLFASGGVHVQNMALQMFNIAYTHLERPELLRIIKTHLQDRKKGSDLSVLMM